MAIFVTELNSDPAAVAFLEDYACERYDRYNQSLLFEQEDREILGQIEELLNSRAPEVHRRRYERMY